MKKGLNPYLLIFVSTLMVVVAIGIAGRKKDLDTQGAYTQDAKANVPSIPEKRKAAVHQKAPERMEQEFKSNETKSDEGESAETSSEGEDLHFRDQEDRVEAELAALERIREIPGAAPLLDEVLAAFQVAGDRAISLESLPVDENGVATLDENSLETIIPDERLRGQWVELMRLVSVHWGTMGQGDSGVE